MQLIIDVQIHCRIEVQVGSHGGYPNMMWVDGIIMARNADTTVWVRVPKADQLYLCEEKHVFVNLKDMREATKATMI
jgi:prepilin-type processing-associated H-X9-DG protein